MQFNPSIIHNEIKYSAPSDQDGLVIATDTKTLNTLWSKHIYKDISTIDNKEICSRCTIDQLKIENNSLIVSNRDNRTLSIDLNSLKVNDRS